jgi:hypothetical protein
MKLLSVLATIILALHSQEVLKRRPLPAAGGPTHTFSFTSTGNTHCQNVGTSTNAGCTLGASVGSSKLVVVGVGSVALTGTLAVSDGGSCTAAKTTSNGSSGTNDATAGTAWLFFFYSASGCGTTWTATATSTTFFGITVDVVSVSGAGSVVQDGGDVIGNGTGTTTINTPSVPSTTTGDLQVCYASPEDSISSANSPWSGDGGGAGGSMVEFIFSSSSSQACNFTQINTTHWDSIGATFK